MRRGLPVETSERPSSETESDAATGTSQPLVLGARVAAWAGAGAVILIISWGLRRGFDLTDEGFYLLNYEPDQDPSGFTRFGPLVRLLLFGWVPGVIGLRVLHLVAVLGGSLYLAVGYSSWARAAGQPAWASSPWTTVPLVTTAAAVGYTFGPPTLSYNHLVVLCAQIVVGSAFSLAAGRPTHRHALALGAASLAMLLVKFPSVPGALLVALLIGFSSGAPDWRRALPAALAGGLLLFAVYSFAVETPVALWKAVSTDPAVADESSYRLTPLLRTYGSSLMSLLRELVKFTPLIVVLAGLAFLQTRPRRSAEGSSLLAAVAALAVSGLALLSYRSGMLSRVDRVSYVYVLVAVTLVAVALASQLGDGARRWRATSELAVPVALAAAPLAVAFGTNNLILTSAVHHIHFWVLLSLVLALSSAPAIRRTTALSAAAIVAVVATSQLVNVYVMQPYRLSATLIEQQVPAPPSSRLDGLLLDPETAALAAEVSGVEVALGYPDHVVGLYRLPGLVWLLHATAPGEIWLTPDFPRQVICAGLEGDIGDRVPVVRRVSAPPPPCRGWQDGDVPLGYEQVAILRPAYGDAIEVLAPAHRSSSTASAVE